jgi:hypothetical protein
MTVVSLSEKPTDIMIFFHFFFSCRNFSRKSCVTTTFVNCVDGIGIPEHQSNNPRRFVSVQNVRNVLRGAKLLSIHVKISNILTTRALGVKIRGTISRRLYSSPPPLHIPTVCI